MQSTTAGNSVGAGTLVGGPQMLPMAGTTYGPERRQGGLMDPRNYGVFGYGQSSPRNTRLNGQSFQGCTGCGSSTRCMSRFSRMSRMGLVFSLIPILLVLTLPVVLFPPDLVLPLPKVDFSFPLVVFPFPLSVFLFPAVVVPLPPQFLHPPLDGLSA